MRRRNPIVWTLLILFLLYTLSGQLAWILTDWMWFEAQSKASVFTTMLGAQVVSFFMGVLLTAGPVLISVFIALRTTRNRPTVLPQDWQGTPLERLLLQPGAFARVVMLLGIGLSLVFGLTTMPAWPELLAWWNKVPMGYTEPLFDHDAAFYVWTLPLLQRARSLLTIGLFFATIATALIYIFRGVIRVVQLHSEGEVRSSIRMQDGPKLHLAIVASLALLSLAFGTWLDRFELLYRSGTLIDGPGFAQVKATLPLLTAQAVVTALCAVVLFVAIRNMRGGLFSLAVALYVLTAIGAALIPSAVQQLVVLPNELNKESFYIGHHIDATRKAWSISEVEERSLTGQAELTWDDIQNNQATIQNIRLWDHGPLLDTFRQLQEIRTYYDFSNVDNDRYVIDGELRQTMLSPRELIVDDLPAQAKTWVNESLVYTHGYGVAMGPVNEVTTDGLPRLWVQDIPPVTTKDPLRIDQPAIYYGREMPYPVFVRTTMEEFDYPTGEGNAYAVYEGGGGVPVGGLVRRTLMAMRLNTLKVFLSSDIKSSSKLMLYRTVTERVRRIAPYLWFDNDPYLVVSEGRLKWIVEAYTHTDRFPYSAHRTIRTGPLTRYNRGVRMNYLRNAIKVVVDAYDGSVTFYREDETDPISDTWAAAFPELFRPLDEMPSDLRSHMRYPFTLFKVQSELFTTFHMTQNQIFYNREDQWEVPQVSGKPMSPYFTVMKLPGEQTEEFILMLPFTPKGKDNLAAWMVARSDGDAYGDTRVYRFPKDRLVYGPAQVVARTRQNDAISASLTLWNQQSSQAILGTLLVIPIEESLIYVQPLYLRADSDAIPELKRVIVGYEDKITMQTTLDEGLAVLFGGSATEEYTTEEGTTMVMVEGTPEVLVRDAAQTYQAMVTASQTGNWAAFGQQLDRLGDVIVQLEQKMNGAPPSDAPSEAEQDESGSLTTEEAPEVPQVEGEQPIVVE